MRKILSLFLGLMSLVGLSSCEDKMTYDKEKNFMPIGYLPKSVTVEDMNKDDFDITNEVTSLQVLGLRRVAFDEIEKSDWKIITQSEISLRGNEPLELENHFYEFGKKMPSELIEIGTNYESIPVIFGNTKVTYQYMGGEVELEPLDEVRLMVKIKELSRTVEPFFTQYGEIQFLLTIGYVTVKSHKIEFTIIDPKIG